MSIWFSYLPKHPLLYQVEIITFDESMKMPENKLGYKVIMCRKRETLKGYLVNIKRGDVLVNNTKDQNPFTEILLMMATVYHDLDIEISNFGKIVKVDNMKGVRKKWEEIKFKIDHTYTGDVVEPLMKQTDKIISNDELFLNSFRRDPFFFYYFFIYGNYDDKHILYKNNVPLYGFLSESVKVCARLLHTKENKDGITAEVKMQPEKGEEQVLQSQLSKKQEQGAIETEMYGYYTLLQNQKYIETMNFVLKAKRENRTIKEMNLKIEKTEKR
jgi:hypothetical protein